MADLVAIVEAAEAPAKLRGPYKKQPVLDRPLLSA